MNIRKIVMNYPIEDYIINFLARKESPEDVQKLEEWLAADPAHRDELKQWLAAWDTAAITDAAETVSPDKAYQRFMFRVGVENKETEPKISPKVVRMDISRTIRRIAAIFVVSFSLGMLCHYYWAKDQPEQVAFIENMVPLGSKSEIKLPDGSTVALNSGSVLRYSTDYGKSKRDVYLSGEGYFKVAKNSEKLFTVHTPLANITDLGTEFNVKAYPDENMMETTLIKGELAVENGEGMSAIDRPILLKPGQRLSISASDLQPVITQLDPDIAEAKVSWKDHYWRIEREPLQDLAVKLERRYNVRIQVDDRLKNRHFTGTLEDESLEQILQYIQISTPILFDIDGKNVYIRINPEKME